MGIAESSVAQHAGWQAVEARNALLDERRRQVGRMVIALSEATSFEALLEIVAAPEFERFEGVPEVQSAELAARERLEAAAATFAAEDLEQRLVSVGSRYWRERYEALRRACETMMAAYGTNSVDFYRAISTIRGLLG